MNDIGGNKLWLSQSGFLLIKKYWKEYLNEKLVTLNLNKISNNETNNKNNMYFRDSYLKWTSEPVEI